MPGFVIKIEIITTIKALENGIEIFTCRGVVDEYSR